MPSTKTKPAATVSPSEALADEATGTYREVDLTGAPALRPPGSLRPGEKRPMLALADEFKVTQDGVDIKVDVAMDIIDKVDRALEAMAVDPDAYVAWVRSESVNEDDIVALFARYVNDLGDSKRSAN